MYKISRYTHSDSIEQYMNILKMSLETTML